MQKIILILVVTLMLFGCTATRVATSHKHSVALGSDLNFDLLQPASFGQSLSLTQVAEISAEQGQHELVFVLQIQANEMTVIGLLPNGTRVFTILYDGVQIKSEGYNELIEKLDPKFLIADIQISLWPLQTLKEQWLSRQPCYQDGNCFMTEKVHSDNGTKERVISAAEKILVSVQSSQSETNRKVIVFNHLERGYLITLESTN
jgi:uncharacterized protein DUF3261